MYFLVFLEKKTENDGVSTPPKQSGNTNTKDSHLMVTTEKNCNGKV